MSFDIQIKVDPGNAVSAIKGVTDGLTAAEAKGKTAGESMLGVSGAFKSMATAMAQEQAALARLSTMHDQLAVKNSGLVGSFAGIAAAIKREQDVLASIRQPQMEYFDTLTALDKLLERNAISTQEYAEQVTQLNKSMGSTPKAEGGGGIGIGDIAQVAAGGAAGAAVLGIGHQIEDVVDSYAKLDDQYTELYDHAMKFADGGRSVGTVLAQQEQLAASLHTTLAEAMDAYDSVQDAVVDLNLSEQQLIAATKAVGEASVISGKSMAGAGDVLNRLILAMDSGADSGRALKTALIGYDEISDMLTKHFHTTRAGLVELGNQHKITSRDIVQAFIQESAAEQERFDKRKVSIEKETEMLNERIAINLKSEDEMTAVFEAGNPGLKSFNESMHAWGGTLNDDSRATRFLTDEVRNFGKQLDDLKSKTNATVRDGVAGFVNTVIKAGRAATATVANYDELAKHLGIVDPWKVAEEAAKKYEDRLASVRHTLDGLIDAANHIPSKSAGMLGEEASATGAAGYLVGIGPTMTTQQQAAQRYREELSQLVDMTGRLGLSDEQVSQKLAQINAEYNKGIGAVDANVQRQHDLQSMLDSIKKPAQDYARDLEIVSQLYRDGAISAAEYKDKVAAIHSAYDATQKHSNDLATGLHNGWDAIMKDATDTAGHIQTAMTGAFSAIQDSIASMVTKGQFDLNSLGSQLEQILVKLAVQQATGSLIGAIGGGVTGFDYMTPSGPGPALPGFATGGDMLVGGAGAPDSKLAMFRVSPGESIHVRTPEQRAAVAQSAAGSGGASHTIVNLNYDPKAIQSGKAIESGVMNAIKSNRAAVRALLGLP